MKRVSKRLMSTPAWKTNQTTASGNGTNSSLCKSGLRAYDGQDGRDSSSYNRLKCQHTAQMSKDP